jgi:hypothetical protein
LTALAWKPNYRQLDRVYVVSQNPPAAIEARLASTRASASSCKEQHSMLLKQEADAVVTTKLDRINAERRSVSSAFRWDAVVKWGRQSVMLKKMEAELGVLASNWEIQEWIREIVLVYG